MKTLYVRLCKIELTERRIILQSVKNEIWVFLSSLAFAEQGGAGSFKAIGF
ncbi:MAG: hypothetical protein ACTS78_04075 [Arsenophonus sp. NC-WZS1-MAG3]